MNDELDHTARSLVCPYTASWHGMSKYLKLFFFWNDLSSLVAPVTTQAFELATCELSLALVPPPHPPGRSPCSCRGLPGCSSHLPSFKARPHRNRILSLWHRPISAPGRTLKDPISSCCGLTSQLLNLDKNAPCAPSRASLGHDLPRQPHLVLWSPSEGGPLCPLSCAFAGVQNDHRLPILHSCLVLVLHADSPMSSPPGRFLSLPTWLRSGGPLLTPYSCLWAY